MRIPGAAGETRIKAPEPSCVDCTEVSLHAPRRLHLGNASSCTPNASDPVVGWKGRPFVPEAGGLYDMRARWWSPSLGVFLSMDDYEFYGRTGTLWSWPKQNPIRYSDPSGHTDREGNVDLKNLAGMSEGERRAVGVVSLLAVALAVGPGWVGVLAVGATVANHDEMGKFVFAVPAIAGMGKATEVAGVAEDACPLHKKAVEARDSLAKELAMQKHPPATVVGAYSPSTGQVAAGASRGGGLGCAEGVCAEALGTPPDIQFTPAIRPRTGASVDVCVNCESTYGRSAFPDPATKFSSDK